MDDAAPTETELQAALETAAPLRIEYPPELPISARVSDIREALLTHQVVIVAGATGSGKTTQLPKVALEVYNSTSSKRSDATSIGAPAPKKQPRTPIIGVTQPRRIAATSVATRVAEELNSSLGREVGYQIRFENRTSRDTQLKFMTDGILLSEIQTDPLLRRYHTLIVDEAHERGLTIDFLLGWLRRILPKRPDLKLIVSSATIETDRFSEFFGGAPVITVEGRTYPVDVLYEPPDPELELSEAVAQSVENLASLDPHGDFLVFLPGEREIAEAERALTAKKLRHTEILPLYARLSATEQNRVFSSRSMRRIILATNVAETSLTIPGIVYVIDAGVARLSRYDSRTGITRLHIEPISRASADQRKGRAGRVREGICVRLYEESNFLARPPYTDPEVLRVGLDGVILRMKSLGLGDVESFPFIDAPRANAVNEGYRVLTELGALDDDRNLTPIGKQLARFPVDPRVARMILQAVRYDVLPEVLTLAAALEIQDVRERPRDRESQADQAHRRFRNETSDFLGLLQLWKFLDAAAKQSGSQLRRVCKDNFLSYRRVREWREVHRQLESTVRELGLGNSPKASASNVDGATTEGNRAGDSAAGGGPRRSRRNRGNKTPPSTAEPRGQSQSHLGLEHTAKIHCALLSGLLSRIGQYNPERRVYFGARQTRFVIHPSSGLAKKPPAWVMAFELVETSQLFARGVAKVDPEWFPLVADHLLKRSYSEPRWSEASGRAVIKEHATLFGLQVLKDRSVNYATVAPGRARLIFLDHALVRGEYNSRGAFQQANRTLLEQVSHLRNKARRSDMLSDDEALLTFFDRRVPHSVVDGKTFEGWRERAEQQDPKLLYLGLSDVLLADENLDPSAYPDELEVAGTTLFLSYLFEPTRDNDGITVSVPLAALTRLDPALLDWTIPAWHETKLRELLLRLPKSTQRRLGNVAELAGRLAERLTPFEEPFSAAVEAKLRELTGVSLAPGELRPDLLPGYLRLTCRVTGPGGKILAEGRDIAALFEQFGANARAALSEAQNTSEWRKTNVRDWDFDTLPEVVTEVVHGTKVDLYPAIIDRKDSVELSPVSSSEEAHQCSLEGVTRLVILTNEHALSALQKQIPKNVEPLLAQVSPLGPSGAQRDSFRRQLAERALREALSAYLEPLPRTRDAFQQLSRMASTRLPAELQKLLPLVNAITPELRETRAVLAAAAKQPSGAAAVRDMQAQLEQLFPNDCLLRFGVSRLQHYARYLKGMRVRLSRAIADPRKDADKAGPVLQVWNLYQLRLSQLHPEQAEHLRWALEELRIATFAPELKPAIPVSAAKLKLALGG